MANILKRNLKARKGKQRWRRNIQVTMGEQGDVDFTQNNKGTIGFQIDTQPVNIYEDINRFKKAPVDESKMSRTELLKIKKLAARKQAVVQKQEQGIVDIWGDNKVNNKVVQPDVKTVITPHPGQSYNPAYKDYSSLVDSVVAQELKSQSRMVNVETNEQKMLKLIEQDKRQKNKQKLRQIERKQGKEVINQLAEKQTNHQIAYIRQINKDVDKEHQEQVKKQKAIRIQKKLIEKIKQKTGRLIKPKVVGRRIVKATEDEVVAEDDLKSRLRHVTQGDMLVRNQFDGYFRRGIMEPKSKSNKLAKQKLQKYKISRKDAAVEDDALFKARS